MKAKYRSNISNEIGSELRWALNGKYTSDFENSVPKKTPLKILYWLHVEIVTFSVYWVL